MTISGYDRRTGEPTSTPTVEDHTELADPTAWPAGLPGEPCWVAWPQSLTVAALKMPMLAAVGMPMAGA